MTTVTVRMMNPQLLHEQAKAHVVESCLQLTTLPTKPLWLQVNLNVQTSPQLVQNMVP